jgi:hypothetical protein
MGALCVGRGVIPRLGVGGSKSDRGRREPSEFDGEDQDRALRFRRIHFRKLDASRSPAEISAKTCQEGLPRMLWEWR